MKKVFVVFKKQPQEITNAYSLVEKSMLSNLPQDQILKKKEVADKLYSTEELDKLRDDLVK